MHDVITRQFMSVSPAASSVCRTPGEEGIMCHISVYIGSHVSPGGCWPLIGQSASTLASHWMIDSKQHLPSCRHTQYLLNIVRTPQQYLRRVNILMCLVQSLVRLPNSWNYYTLNFVISSSSSSVRYRKLIVIL